MKNQPMDNKASVQNVKPNQKKPPKESFEKMTLERLGKLAKSKIERVGFIVKGDLSEAAASKRDSSLVLQEFKSNRNAAKVLSAQKIEFAKERVQKNPKLLKKLETISGITNATRKRAAIDELLSELDLFYKGIQPDGVIHFDNVTLIVEVDEPQHYCIDYLKKVSKSGSTDKLLAQQTLKDSVTNQLIRQGVGADMLRIYPSIYIPHTDTVVDVVDVMGDKRWEQGISSLFSRMRKDWKSRKGQGICGGRVWFYPTLSVLSDMMLKHTTDDYKSQHFVVGLCRKINCTMALGQYHETLLQDWRVKLIGPSEVAKVQTHKMQCAAFQRWIDTTFPKQESALGMLVRMSEDMSAQLSPSQILKSADLSEVNKYKMQRTATPKYIDVTSGDHQEEECKIATPSQILESAIRMVATIKGYIRNELGDEYRVIPSVPVRKAFEELGGLYKILQSLVDDVAGVSKHTYVGKQVNL